MFDKVKEAVTGAANKAGEVTQEAATNAAIKSVQRTLDVMELAALASLDRPAVRGVTVTGEVELFIGRVSISAEFDPEKLKEMLQDDELLAHVRGEDDED